MLIHIIKQILNRTRQKLIYKIWIDDWFTNVMRIIIQQMIDLPWPPIVDEYSVLD